MDQREAIKIAKRYVRSISNNYTVERAFLFGSYARKTNRPDSDIDIALVLKDVTDIFDTQVKLMQLRKNEDILIEPHPYRNEDFNINDPVVNEILQFGIEIKAA